MRCRVYPTRCACFWDRERDQGGEADRLYGIIQAVQEQVFNTILLDTTIIDNTREYAVLVHDTLQLTKLVLLPPWCTRGYLQVAVGYNTICCTSLM